MVKLFKNICLYWRFKHAIRVCNKRNQYRTTNKYIVANICGYPYILNRPLFRTMRKKGVFRQNLKWIDVYKRRITSNTLQQWLS
ncbi:MAG: hypothetical protein NC346_08170 [Prevotella sp.]|nr:hypothetical protein [Prevotella sp.]MCM1403234.1 hypothetical protein [Bacteroides sp.]MCM1576330.1 hypothetical protein [Bacteroides sp.]